MYAGSYCSEEERNEVKVKEMNDITYSMLSYTYGTNGIPVPEGKEYMVNVWPTDLAINDPDSDDEYGWARLCQKLHIPHPALPKV